MNAARRKDLARAVELLNEARAIVEGAASDEQDYYDAMPDSLQMSDKGDAASEAADTLSTAAETIESVISDIEGVV